ncbi:MAG: heme o synthase [Verrucomicrobiae bacterium]|nr:heme o synthase [Verrucomicrobiae bacterium]
MKASISAERESATPMRGVISMLAELTKARLTALVLITTLTGFFVAGTGMADWLTGLHVLLGTGLVAAGAAALNEWWERDLDRLMERTSHRPLPSGEIEPWFALAFGLSTGLAGVVYLAALVNGLTAVLGALAMVSYVLVYTPLKRVTAWNTVIGAVPGALPPLMGWTAARGEMGLGGLALFGILFLWQIPHFMAIAWLYRDEYARAGYRMLPVVDPGGRATGWATLGTTLLLLAVSLVPVGVGIAGPLYGAGATILGIGFLAMAARFTHRLERHQARLVFFASILYLPLLLGLLMLDNASRILG